MLLVLLLLSTQDYTKTLNEAARQKMAPGLEFSVEGKPLPDAVRELSSAAELPVLVDRTFVAQPEKRKVTLTLKKGVPLGDSLTAALKAYKLAWTLQQGALIVTDAAGKADLEKGAPIGGAGDEALKKAASLWEKRDSPLELPAGLGVSDALHRVATTLGIGVEEQYLAGKREDKVDFGATALPPLAQLRLICRSQGMQFEIRNGKLLFQTDSGTIARATDEARLQSTIQSARTAGLSGQKTIYSGLLPALRKQKERAQEIIRDLIDSPNEDAKGREVLKQLLKDIG